MMRHEACKQKKTIMERLKDGEDVAALAKEYDLTSTYVDQLRALAGIKRPRMRSCYSDLGWNAYCVIAALLTNKESMAAIARRLKISRQRVDQIRDKAYAAGIPVKPARK